MRYVVALMKEKLREFMAKMESGESSFKRLETRMKLATVSKSLSSTIQYGSNLMIKSDYADAFLAITIPDQLLSARDTNELQCTTSKTETKERAAARCVFQLERLNALNEDPLPRFGEKFYIKIQLEDNSSTVSII